MPCSDSAAPVSLLERVLALFQLLGLAFCQERTAERAARLALGHALTLGEHNIARVLATCGRDQMDWSTDYQLFSHSPWSTRELFAPVLDQAVKLALPESLPADAPLWVAGDHTHVLKTGKKVAGLQTIRDPMSPAYHVNLVHGLRFFHLCVIAAPWRTDPALADVPARALPVRFELSPTLKKPGKRADADALAQYKLQRRDRSSTKLARAQLLELREDVDAQGGAGRKIIAALDGAFANKIFFREPMRGVELVARVRRDAALCYAHELTGAEVAKGKSRRFFGKEKFSPEAVRIDEQRPWQEALTRTGGKAHSIRYKEIAECYWQRGAGRRQVRVLVLAPTGYRLSKNSRMLYRQPGFLVTTDLHMPAPELIQGYVDRWQIEVMHRELKDTYGLEDSQVRNARSVPRHAAFGVAVCSLLHIAALLTHGALRTKDYLAPARWHRHSANKRASLLDIVQLLRAQASEHLAEAQEPEWQRDSAAMTQRVREAAPEGMFLRLKNLLTKAAA